MRGLPSSASSFVDGVGENTKGMLQLVPYLFDHSEQSSGQSSGSSKSGDNMVPRGSIARLSAKASAMDSLLDVRNPALNNAIDGVLKIGGVGAAHAATQEAYSWMRKGTKANRSSSSPISNSSGLPAAQAPTTRRDIEKIVYKAGKEGLQWGMVAGMYASLEYGMEKVRGGKHDWVVVSFSFFRQWNCKASPLIYYSRHSLYHNLVCTLLVKIFKRGTLLHFLKKNLLSHLHATSHGIQEYGNHTWKHLHDISRFDNERWFTPRSYQKYTPHKFSSTPSY